MKRFKLKGVFLIITTIIIVAGLLLAGCAKTAPAKVYTLNWGYMWPTDSPDEKMFLCLANQLDEQSNGRLQLNFIGGCMAAPPGEMLDAVQSNIIQIASESLMSIATRIPLFTALALPGVVKLGTGTAQQLTINALYNKYPEIQKEFDGVKVLCFGSPGSMSAVNTVDKQVQTLEDMKGLILITWGSVDSDFWKALGASPTVFPMGEIYDALAKGTADGIGTPLVGHVQNTKTHELCNYTTKVNDSIIGWVNVMNVETFNSLPPDLQELLSDENLESFWKAQVYQVDELEVEISAWLDKYLKDKGYPGVESLSAEEEARWREAVQPIYDAWLQKATELVGEAKAKAMLDDAIKFGSEAKMTDDIANEAKDWLKKWGYPGF